MIQRDGQEGKIRDMYREKNEKKKGKVVKQS